jgi:3-oxoacyl-[acyl-carrier protein] reductase
MINVSNQLFIVGGISSGLGYATGMLLLEQGATVIGICRNKNQAVQEANDKYANLEVSYFDITKPAFLDNLPQLLKGRQLHGILLNAGGPPAKTIQETTAEDWDNAYDSLLRWKVLLTQALIPNFIQHNYGRILFLESASVKQPMENLVLSNSLRLAVVGFAKTLSQEVGNKGITVNIIAPGFHDTPAMQRLFNKKVEQLQISQQEAIAAYTSITKTKTLGKAEQFAQLATWLLGPNSAFVTGQTISVDGGVVSGTFG